MTESEFNKLVDGTLGRIADAIDASGEDIDCETVGGGILELEFDNGSKIVINRQAAMQEIWVAAKSGGFHYRWQDDAWRDTRSGDELLASLVKLIAEQSGATIALK
jgi:CyaY protein